MNYLRNLLVSLFMFSYVFAFAGCSSTSTALSTDNIIKNSVNEKVRMREILGISNE